RPEVPAAPETQTVAVAGRSHRLLPPRRGGEAVAAVLDRHEVAEVEALIDLVNACRAYAGELAVNEATLRVHSQLEHYLDSGMPALLDGLRHAGAGERNFRQSQVDAAARFAAKVFGAQYAAVLAKAADVPAQGPAPGPAGAWPFLPPFWPEAVAPHGAALPEGGGVFVRCGGSPAMM